MSADLLGPVIAALAAGILVTIAYVKAAKAAKKARAKFRRIRRTRVAVVLTQGTGRPRRRTRR